MTAEGGRQPRINKVVESHCQNRYAEEKSSSHSRDERHSSSDSANSTQDFFYSKKQANRHNKKVRKDDEQAQRPKGLLVPPACPLPRSGQSTAGNPDRLPPKGKAQSSMYMFTFSNNEEEVIKRAGQNYQNHGFHYTPTSSSGATTMGHSFS